MSTSKTIVLKSSDGETFEVEAAVAMESQTIKHLIDDNCADTSIPLPDVTGKILAKVIEYCKRQVDAPKSDDKAPEDDLKKFEEEFGKVDHNTFFDLILAAHYLNIGSLLNLTRQTLADLSKGKNPEEASRENSWAYDETVADTSMMKSLEEIRKTSNIRNDFTPEAEDEARRKILTIKNDFLLTEQELFCRQNPWAFE